MRFFIIARNLLFCAATLALLAGCSISYSSGKSSDSSTTSSDSSSASSGSESKQAESEVTRYMEDVSAMTVLYVSQKKNSDEFQRQITNIAINHNITDWEKENDTFIAMGRGLKRAGVNEDNIANVPYFNTISQSPNYSIVIEGYEG